MDAVAPAASLTAPAANAVLTGLVNLTATATDNYRMSKVDFFVGTAVVGSVTASPYAKSWNSALVADGAHVLKARATDAAGNQTLSAGVSVTVDNAPNTTILSKPANPTNLTSASFTFNSNQTGSTFECNLDGAGYAACTSPRVFTGLASGAHTFLVKATDTTAHTDATPASLTWTIEQTAPTVSLTAPADNAAVTGSFTLSATAADSFKMGRVEVLINGSVVGSDSTATAGSYSYLWNSTSRGDGPVTLQARAVDAAGNKTTSASRTLNMDNAPNTTITSGPTGTVTATSATFSFTATQAGSTFECSLDAGAYAACISPVSYTGLAVGAHTFKVRATDATGHVDSTPALRTWKIQ